MRFGLTDGQPKTLDEIGKVYGVTVSGSARSSPRRWSKLRHPSRSQVLRDYLDRAGSHDDGRSLHNCASAAPFRNPRLYAERARSATTPYVRRVPFARRGSPRPRRPLPDLRADPRRRPFVTTPLTPRDRRPRDHRRSCCATAARASSPGTDHRRTSTCRSWTATRRTTRLRRLVAPAFSPRQDRGVRDSVEKTAADLLDDVGRLLRTGRVDPGQVARPPLPIDRRSRPVDPDADTRSTGTAGDRQRLSGIRSLSTRAGGDGCGRAIGSLEAVRDCGVAARRTLRSA